MSNHFENVKNQAESILKSPLLKSLPVPYGMKKALAFTLAEILIALVVIGVVASMVISPLVQEIQDVQLKTAWKNAYANISQAVKMYSIDQYGDLRGVFTGPELTAAGGNDFRNKILTYLVYTQKCDANSALGTNGCWHATGSWYKLSGSAGLLIGLFIPEPF